MGIGIAAALLASGTVVAATSGGAETTGPAEPSGFRDRRAIRFGELPPAVQQGAVNIQSNQSHSHIPNCTVNWDLLSAGPGAREAKE